ncbi:MAG: hypothetical protein H6851_08590 [Geminicoccaceae bacterium]|nr:hypothetical protein [Geminicoccaceae bacterium]
MLRRLAIVACVVLGVAASGPASVRAMEMVAGGFGSDPSEFFVPPSAGLHSRFVEGASRSAIGVGEFTPRGSILGTGGGASRGNDFGLSLGIDTSWLDRLQRPLASAPTTGLYGVGSMLVGGGLKVSDIGVMGGFGRTRLFGATTDMVAAGLSYGRVNARVAFGQPGAASAGDGSVRDVMMFSTDLAAWSWLTLEGDVAVGTVAEDGDQAVGRVGVRLQF